jgi:hypothetical protein
MVQLGDRVPMFQSWEISQLAEVFTLLLEEALEVKLLWIHIHLEAQLEEFSEVVLKFLSGV